MAQKRHSTKKQETEIQDYRHDTAARTNNPPAGIASHGQVHEQPRQVYAYNPHLPPSLQFDGNGDADQLPELLYKAQRAPLSADEVQILAAALKNHNPWIEWAGKQEAKSFAVDPVALHIHERVSAKAIVKVAERENVQRELFADPQLKYLEAVQFYQHDVDWTNRLILGDSLTVMSSLAEREDLAGKVQMIYIDPPYGIRFASNFQPTVFQRYVKDKAGDLTREREQIKAYRDTWTLGIHSYLAYLRDRLIVAKELLTDSGSIFVQISDENVHRVRCIMDEVFGSDNFIVTIIVTKTGSHSGDLLEPINDYIVWFAKDKTLVKGKKLFVEREWSPINTGGFNHYYDDNGEVVDARKIPPKDKNWLFRGDPLLSSGHRETTSCDIELDGKIYSSGYSYHWTVNVDGIKKLHKSGRTLASGKSVSYKRYFGDFPVKYFSNMWSDLGGASGLIYIVQTNTKIIERCLLMTTDPGDLVLDPTCVRKGTRILSVQDPNPPVSPRKRGEEFGAPLPGKSEETQSSLLLKAKQARLSSPPLAEVSLTPIENLRPGDWVLSHTGKPRRIRRAIRKPYRGQLIGIEHAQSPTTLWVTADHYIRCKQRILSYGKERAWSEVPPSHFGRARELRKEITAAEKALWYQLCAKQLGVKFRRQHPIGPYITDFYARDVELIVEVDGDTHLTPEAKSYDTIRTDYLSQLGLTVLRFTNREILWQIEDVMEQINHTIQAVRPSETPSQQWRRSDSLRVGDIVYFGVHRKPVEISNIQHTDADEEVYDLEIETDHSYLTEVCAVHNCGSGTTAYVAENWGRRWIAIDTSRVAIALARQRLLTGTFDYYQLNDASEGVAGGFVNKTVPHITPRSIAQNTALDPIFAKYEPILAEKLETLNLALAGVTPELRTKLLSKLAEKERREGKRAITDTDRRRWQLPNGAWQEWEVPFDTDPDWPDALREALTDYREAFRAKMEEVNGCITASADSEELVDQPEVDRKKLRVSGPFTVEAVQPAEASLGFDSPIGGEPEEDLDAFESDGVAGEPINAEAYLDQMIRLLRNDGVRFPDNQKMKFAALDPLEEDILHAEGSWEGNDEERNVAVVFGPQHGPVTTTQVEACLPIASQRGYNQLIFAGFSFDGAAQATLQADPHPRVRIHMAHINPDVTMGDLLKETPSSQLFTVFGAPRTEIEMTKDEEYIVKMEGVDIYNPVENTVSSAGSDKVAAWFVDSDYDGRTFCITQAFFPDKKAWNKIARALKGVIDIERFEKFSGTESLPFPAGEHHRVAVKVIDPRGNEVMRVHDLGKREY